jgi:GMP synthase (glutamine-hydrolysing)
MAQTFGGEVARSNSREYGRAHLSKVNKDEALLASVTDGSQIWMSHGDTITRLPEGFEVIATTENIPVAAFKSVGNITPNPMFALQFHPEVTHSIEGKQIIKNFLVDMCKFTQDWTPMAFVKETVDRIKAQIGDKRAIMALSGGVDSTVAAMLVHKAIGANLFCIFVDNGLLRKDEFAQVLDAYKHLGLNIKGVDASATFYKELAGVTDPEAKRKIIGRLFIDVFQEEATHLTDISFLGQGTIYPDVIESMSVNGPSATIKSHHNVGGLPEKMNMQLVEPLRSLFKDEVRRVGKEIGVDDIFLKRHPFPGPGLGIRILGEVTADKAKMLQEADAIYINGLRDWELYDQVWQAGAILLPVQSVGVMGDERTYEYTLALRAVTSVDGMTADWAHLPYEFLAHISNEIINKVRGINRVVYDISSKPPATIEWE